MRRSATLAVLALCASCSVDLPNDGVIDGTGPLDYALRARHANVELTPFISSDASITTMAIREGDDALYLVIHNGLVYRKVPPTLDDLAAGVEPRDDLGELVLDMSELTMVGGEEGFGGLAFDPTGTRAYVYHSRPDDGFSVLAEYVVEPGGDFVEGSRRELFVVEQSSFNHNGGQLLFGADSMLYIGVGDGSEYADGQRAALDFSSPLGKILRIDPTPSADLPYSIPPDNPTVDFDGADPRIWARGLRNPSTFSFDPLTGDLWIADVGQGGWEEINYAPAVNGLDAGKGRNFGWSAFEGPDRFNFDQPTTDHTEARIAYPHPDPECGAVQDGLVVRDSLIAELNGWYLYGDWCQGKLWAHDLIESGADSVLIADIEHFTQVIEAADGNLYVSSHSFFDVRGGVFIVSPGRANST